MITTGMFIALMAGVACSMVYSVWDSDNRHYGNIITAFLGTVFSFYLSSSISGGNVIFSTTGEILQDSALSYLFKMIGLIMGLLVLLMDAESQMLYQSERNRMLWEGKNHV